MKQRKKSRLYIETILIIFIAFCIVFLNFFMGKKVKEMNVTGLNSMFVKSGISFEESEDFANQITKYKPNYCKMIEIYDESYELIISLTFIDENISNSDIRDYQELINIFNSNEHGQTTVNIDDHKESVYFQWIENDRNERRLLLIYSSFHIIDDLWIFSFVCYLILILMFILLIRLHTVRYLDKVNEYKLITDSVINEVNRK